MNPRSSPLVQARDAFDAGDFARLRVLAEDAVRAADKSRGRASDGGSPPSDESSRAEARRLLALALLYDDKVDDAERLAEEALRIARAAGSTRETALCELALAEILRARGDYVAGLKHAARARQIAERSGDTPTGATVLSDYALLLSRVGDDERAREAFDILLAMPLGAFPRARALRVLYNSAMAHRAAGRFDLALRILDRADRAAGLEARVQGGVAHDVGASAHARRRGRVRGCARAPRRLRRAAPRGGLAARADARVPRRPRARDGRARRGRRGARRRGARHRGYRAAGTLRARADPRAVADAARTPPRGRARGHRAHRRRRQGAARAPMPRRPSQSRHARAHRMRGSFAGSGRWRARRGLRRASSTRHTRRS